MNELQYTCSTHNIIQVIKSRTSWTRLVAYMDQRVHTGFGGETRRKDSTWKTKTKMKNNITMNLKEVSWKDMTWPDLTQDVTMAGSCEQSTEY
jgi:hypothetical protein